MPTLLALSLLVILLLAVLAARPTAAPAHGPYTQPGYIQGHLHTFRVHVNRMRRLDCRRPWKPFTHIAAELAVASAGVRRRVQRVWTGRHTGAHRDGSLCTPWYITKQIWAGNILGRESSGDPWPNCPDPWDGSGASWTDTVGCENSGNWLDSPGYYRCGLQFDPMWERRFGRLCP